jgi:probable ATP-dependent RNA helicase DDX4
VGVHFVGVVSSNRLQQEREEALRDFRNGRSRVLVATSVAARGLDFPVVKHVINYDLPSSIEDYVYHIRRTGRIGDKGMATAFFDKGRDAHLARALMKVLVGVS